MAKQKTKVINKTGSAVNLTMATGGIQSQESMKPVEHSHHYMISVEVNATYREYWCALEPGNKYKVVLSSDACVEFSEVTLIRKANGSYDWEGTKYRKGRGPAIGFRLEAGSTSTTTAPAPQQVQSPAVQPSSHSTAGAPNSSHRDSTKNSSRSRPRCCMM